MRSPLTILNARPPLKFSDFSGFSGSAPSAIAIGEPTGKVPTSTSPTPVRLTVEVVEKNRSEEHTSELQSLMRTSNAVFRLKKNKNTYKSKSIINKHSSTSTFLAYQQIHT